MKYVKAKWLTASPGDPLLLYSELDDSRLEIRKIDVYSNGSAGWADRSSEHGSARLGIVPPPSLDEINAQGDFDAVEITPEEFERVWISFRN